MRALDAFQIARKLIKQELERNPDKQYKRPSGQTLALRDVLTCFERLIAWLYPELTDDDLVKVVRCKHCRHYKKVKGEKFNTFKWVCALTQENRKENGFCDRGCEK